jgi:hypothetical protein
MSSQLTAVQDQRTVLAQEGISKFPFYVSLGPAGHSPERYRFHRMWALFSAHPSHTVHLPGAGPLCIRSALLNLNAPPHRSWPSWEGRGGPKIPPPGTRCHLSSMGGHQFNSRPRPIFTPIPRPAAKQNSVGGFRSRPPPFDRRRGLVGELFVFFPPASRLSFSTFPLLFFNTIIFPSASMTEIHDMSTS